MRLSARSSADGYAGKSAGCLVLSTPLAIKCRIPPRFELAVLEESGDGLTSPSAVWTYLLFKN